MIALVLDGVPTDSETQKSEAPWTVSIMGTAIFRTEFVKALLKYGTYDRYFFLSRNSWNSLDQYTIPGALPQDKRVNVLFPGSLDALRRLDSLVFFSGGPQISQLLPLRRYLRRQGSPISGMIHSLNGSILRPLLLTTLMDHFYHYDALICSSACGRAALQGHLSELRQEGRDCSLRFPIIPIGIDLTPFRDLKKETSRSQLNLDSRNVLLLYLGRFSPATKVDLKPILMVLSRLCRERSTLRVQLVLAGDDTEMGTSASLLSLVEQLGCGASVTIRPNPSREEKFRLLSAADIFLAPSDNLQETFGISLLEAMAAGLPVVAADWNGYREIVQHQHTGFLVPTYMPDFGEASTCLNATSPMLSDFALSQSTCIDIEVLSRYLAVLISNADLRTTMGDNARRRVASHYEWMNVIRLYEDFWGNCLTEARLSSVVDQEADTKPLLTCSYPDVFAAHPTEIVSGDSVVQMDPSVSGSEIAATVNCFFEKNLFFEQRLALSIIDKVTEERVITIDDLISKIGTSGGRQSWIEKAHVFKLLKYGVLKLVR